jgi:hypothetical protein
MTAQLLPHIARPVALYPTPPTGSTGESDPALALLRSPMGWLSQLRVHYPTGSLVSELLQIHEHQFIVRAMVQVEGVTLVTAMAAAEQLEVAEDRAQLRALALLGLPGSTLAEPTHPPTVDPAVLPLASPVDASSLPMPVFPVTPPVINAEGAISPVIDPVDSVVSDAVQAVPVTPPIARSTKPKPKSESAKPARLPDIDEAELPTPPPLDLPPLADEAEPPRQMAGGGTNLMGADDPIDLSDAIAQIGTEIERIGWNRKQGRAYLEKTYSKHTRAELTEEELLEFLDYLKALPGKDQVGLSPVPF